MTLRTTGRRTGGAVETAVGYVEEPDGRVLIAAGEPDADWALNLFANPRCHVTLATASWDAVAEPVEGADAAAAVTALILRYGTPAEGLGRGPVFRLRPVSVSLSREIAGDA